MSGGMLRLPPRLLFGCGALAAAGPAVAELGIAAAVFTDATLGASAPVETALESMARRGLDVRLFDGCRPDLPLDCVEEAVGFARRRRFDVVVGIGGGSCLDLAKAVALSLAAGGRIDRFYGENLVPAGLPPIVAVPTTAGTGSEVSPVAVVADPRRELKVGISSPHLIPSLTICDPEATVGCPPAVTGTAGIDALIHAVESFCAPARENCWDDYPGDVFRGRDPLSRHYALPAIELIASSLERAYAEGSDLQARESMLLGSLWAGISFAHQGTAAAHALQYPVGAATGTPHGLGVGLLAPYTLDAARPEIDSDLALVAAALGVGGGTADPAAAAIDEVERLGCAVGLPASLAELGLGRDQLPRLAAQASGIERLIRNSPRPMVAGDLLAVLEAAWAGDRGSRAKAATR